MTPAVEARLAEIVEQTRWREDMSDAPRDGSEIEMRFGTNRPITARFSPDGTAPGTWRFGNGSALRSTAEAGWQWRHRA